MKRNELIIAKNKIRVLKIAAKYESWLHKHRRFSTFSTFVDEFGYDEADSSYVFKIIEPIRAAANAVIGLP